MMIISRSTGTSYADLLGMSYCEIDRAYDALIWVMECEKEARAEAAREAQKGAGSDGSR